MQLPDQMPDKCNFYGLLQTGLEPTAITQRFTAAGWSTKRSGAEEHLEIGWGRLRLTGGHPMVLQGSLDHPDERVGELLGLLCGPGLTGMYQWINAQGQLWREMPFDESMLDPEDPRLPLSIKQSILASRDGKSKATAARKPWWQFW